MVAKGKRSSSVSACPLPLGTDPGSTLSAIVHRPTHILFHYLLKTPAIGAAHKLLIRET